MEEFSSPFRLCWSVSVYGSYVCHTLKLDRFLFVAGTSAIIVGFSFATENGWSSASTLALICSGAGVLVLGALYEMKTTRDALFPAGAFRQISVG